MDFAYCSKDDTTYNVEKFSILTDAEIKDKRQYLTCPKCFKKAYFRKAYGEIAAVFGANPHTPICGERRTDPAKVRERVKNLRSFIDEGGQPLKLSLSTNATDNADKEKGAISPALADKKRVRPPSAGSSRHRNDWPLAELLAELIRTPDLAESSHNIEAPGVFAAQPMAQFLVNTKNIKAKSLVATKGFWGMVANANWGVDGSLWINSGDYWGGGVRLDIRIMPAIADAFRTQYSTLKLKDLQGCPILVVGAASAFGDEFKVQVERLDRIAILLGEADH